MPLQASDALGTTALQELTNPELPRSRTEPARTVDLAALRAPLERPRHPARALAAEQSPPPAAAPPVRAVPRRRLRADAGHARTVTPYERPPARVEADGVLRFSAHGRDGVLRTTTVEPSLEPAGVELTPGDARRAAATVALRFELEVPAGGTHELTIGFTASEVGAAPVSFGAPSRRPSARASSRTRSSSTACSRDRFKTWRCCARGCTGTRTTPPASRGTRPCRPRRAGERHADAGFRARRGRGHAALAGQSPRHRGRRDARRQARRVLHELRVGEPATLGQTPFARDYGTVDATPLWLSLLSDHADWSGSLDLFRELRPQVDAALGWMERYGDLDGDGLIEYLSRAPEGLVNQGGGLLGRRALRGREPGRAPDRAGRGARLRDARRWGAWRGCSSWTATARAPKVCASGPSGCDRARGVLGPRVRLLRDRGWMATSVRARRAVRIPATCSGPGRSRPSGRAASATS